MSSSYQSPGGPGCPPECFIDRDAPTMWVEADRARRAHEAHAAQPAAEPTPCTGSGLDRLYEPEDVTYRDKGKARYARVTCPACRRPPFTVKVVYSRKGVPLGPEGVVVVPRHRAQEG